jgi:hypothetical protein
MSIPLRRLGLLTTLALLPLTQLVAPAGAATAAADGPPGHPGCATALLARSARAADVLAADAGAFATAAGRNGKDVAAYARLARGDRSLWLDRCGQGFYVEPQGATTAASAPSPATSTVPLADTFTLQSRPGSNRTIYLDFRGGTVTGTAWNSSYGASITVDPYSTTAPPDTAFTDQELTEIQKAWQVVAEDYAPFDVNVTTRDPGADAIDRTSSSDLVYGTRVLVTAGGPIYSSCTCGGIAYTGVFNNAGSSHGYYQPGFVFTNGTGTNGKYVGEAAAHESGHNFGLNHDGTSTSSYYAGSAPWTPIMGSSYGQPVSQWSKGEYAGATNTQDDLAVIATGAPLRPDDHGDTASTATPLAGGATLDGLIGTRSDVDAFSFSASGATTLSVAPAAGLPDLDVSLRIADASGATVATIDPAASRTSYAVAAGLGATWTATLPSSPATYTAFVDGVGTGDPLTAGKYSDYGSLGNYQVTLTTEANAGTATPTPTPTPTPVSPVSVADQSLSGARAGQPFSGQLAASGGDGSYTWSAGAGIPSGMTLSSAGVLSGTPSAAGTWSFAATAASAGSSASGTVTVTVAAATAPLALVTSSLPAGRVGRSYSTAIATSGGTPAYSWTRSGTLPPGTTLSVGTGATATLSGSPTTKGKFSFTVGVTDSSGAAVSRTFSVTVNR